MNTRIRNERAKRTKHTRFGQTRICMISLIIFKIRRNPDEDQNYKVIKRNPELKGINALDQTAYTFEFRISHITLNVCAKTEREKKYAFDQNAYMF